MINITYYSDILHTQRYMRGYTRFISWMIALTFQFRLHSHICKEKLWKCFTKKALNSCWHQPKWFKVCNNCLFWKCFSTYLEVKNESSELSFKNDIFDFFENLEVAEIIFWEGKATHWYLFQGLSQGAIRKLFKLPCGEKTNGLSIWKAIFGFFTNFWVAKLKPFSGKKRQSLKNNVNLKLFLERILE